MVASADLVLLKLNAGGPQDLWDIHQLLDADRSNELAHQVAHALEHLPAGLRDVWSKVIDAAD